MDTAEQEQQSLKSTDEKEYGGAQKLCDRFCVLQLEELIDYAAIFDVIGRDPQANGRSVCLRAIDLALRRYGVRIVCDIGKGYKRVGFEGRREWITAKGQQVERVNVRRFLTASHIQDAEFQTLTVEQKQKLANEQARVGLQLAITERLNKIKKVPPIERIKLVDLSDLGKVFAKK